MPFPYFDRLAPRQQAVYRQSDRVVTLPLPRPEELQPLAEALRLALAGDDRRDVERSARRLSAALLAQLRLPPLEVRVLAVRPRDRGGELHGLYTFGEKDPPCIRVWMRTARHRQVVAFRSFLRTLLHELLHHLDYRHLRLADSFHTEGFFRRESSLFRQLVPEGTARRARPGPGPAAGDDVRPGPRPARRRRGAKDPEDVPDPARRPEATPPASAGSRQGRLPFDD